MYGKYIKVQFHNRCKKIIQALVGSGIYVILSRCACGGWRLVRVRVSVCLCGDGDGGWGGGQYSYFVKHSIHY